LSAGDAATRRRDWKRAEIAYRQTIQKAEGRRQATTKYSIHH
jgi:hypothetical protein